MPGKKKTEQVLRSLWGQVVDGIQWYVYIRVCTYVHAYVSLCVEARGGLGTLLSLSTLAFEAWFFIEAEAGWLSKLDNQSAPASLLSLHPQCCDYSVCRCACFSHGCWESSFVGKALYPLSHLLRCLSAVSLSSIIHFLPWTPATQEVDEEHTSFPQDVTQVGMGHNTPNHTCILWDSAAYWHMVHEWSHPQIENWVIGLTWEPGSRWCQVGATKHTGGVWRLSQKARPLKSDWMGQEDCSGHQLCQLADILVSMFDGSAKLWKRGGMNFLKKKFKKKTLRCILITKKERWKPKGENLLFHSNVGGSGKHYNHWNKLNAEKDEKNLWFHSCGI